ncbi:hypothetical protein NDI76_04415 [Halogeometricum sp. S1BR25-6]|uniref:Amphi-Trp domain-containing protein n=1 Tax=Halogeometricum salsisoli TaxID=2950536 RepID=A0ABU2GAZ5_9EURY|nr:hypothetical protein [Halogeometricum sp. S1BR25-6]MDS0297977.1 hypothetical protein [Halogeometricum sp. S1BR25-6]
MSPSSPSDRTVRTASEFNAALRALIESAHDNGVDVEGGWECRTPPDAPDWDVVVVEFSGRAGAADE